MPRRTDLRCILITRPDRHRSGLRVRLFRRPACKALRESYRVVLVNSIGDDRCRPRRRTRSTSADQCGHGREDHRGTLTRCCRPWADRPRSTARSTSPTAACGMRLRQLIVPRAKRSAWPDRELFHRHGRINLSVRPKSCAASNRQRGAGPDGYPTIIGEFHPRRLERRHRLPRGVRGNRQARARPLAGPGAGRGIRARLESSRWRSSATGNCIIVCRREPRSDGRATGDSITVAPAQTDRP